MSVTWLGSIIVASTITNTMFAAPPVDEGEPVGHQAARDHGADDRRDGVDQGVPEGPQEVHPAQLPSGTASNAIGLGMSTGGEAIDCALRLERRR